MVPNFIWLIRKNLGIKFYYSSEYSLKFKLLNLWYTSVQKKCTPRFGVFKKVLNNKNNLLVKVKFMKK